MTLVLRDVELEGTRTAVEVHDGTVVRIGDDVVHRAGALEIDGHGGALLPGLHDHHLHLLSMAARTASVDCTTTTREADLVRAVRAVPGPWVRVTGYEESLAGPLDRHVLDRWAPGRAVRVQHGSGALWMLSTTALAQVQHVLDDSADVERDADGTPTGRLWRYDARLAPALPPVPLDLGALGADLARHGLTGATDATPDIDPSGVRLLADAVDRGDLPLRVHLLGPSSAAAVPAGRGMTVGARKIVVEDHSLPDVGRLTAVIAGVHATGRSVAVHTVSAESLVITVEALRRAGSRRGDRLEHAAVVLPGLETDLRALGVVVVTQPGFVHAHGDRYRRDVAPTDLPWLYRYATLRDHHVAVVASSDAPFGPVDPWQVMRAASTRRTRGGTVLGPGEAVPTAEVLDSYLRDPADLSRRRRVAVGGPADLCLLRVPLATALAEPSAEHVRLTVTAAGSTERVVGS